MRYHPAVGAESPLVRSPAGPGPPRGAFLPSLQPHLPTFSRYRQTVCSGGGRPCTGEAAGGSPQSNVPTGLRTNCPWNCPRFVCVCVLHTSQT